MSEIGNWMLVFLRISSMLAVFPVFSVGNVPVQVRLALGAILAAMISPMLPAAPLFSQDLWGMVGLMAMEVLVGLMLGFASRMIFYALDTAGMIIGNDIGLQLPPSLNPMSGGQTTAPGTILYWLAIMLWFGLDMHHWMLAAFQRTYAFLPIGGAHLSEAFMMDIVNRTSQTFVVALQLTAPVMAVSFIVSLIFSVLGRAVPQMNVFQESFAIRTLAGLSVFGLTLQLMSQHISNYIRHLPEDMLTVSRLLGH